MKKWLWVLGVVSAAALAACGGGSGGGAAGGSDGGAELATAKAMPSDIVISSPTEEISAGSASISKAVASKEGEPLAEDRKRGDPENGSYMEKRDALNQLMSGAGECGFTLQVPEVPPPECYGPTVDYVAFPGEGAGSFPIGDLGFWNPTQGDAGEACAAAKMNQLVRNVAARVDNMISTLGVAACAANKAEVTLPAVGETLDLTSIAAEGASVTGLTFEEVSIKRLADTAEGYEVYLSTVRMTMAFEDGSVSGEVVLKHIPTASDGSTYKGKLAMKMGMTQNMMIDCVGTSGTTMAGVIWYEKAAADDVKYEFNYAPFCGSDADPFDAALNLVPATANWIHDWNYGLFNLNPENGTGSAVYAWQAGTIDRRTRAFNMSVSAADDGSASGVAFYGFGPDIMTASIPGTIDGFVCNWAGPGGAVGITAEEARASGKGWDKVQRQELVRAADGTLFLPSSSNITYAPANACDTDDADFRYRAVSQDGGAPLNMSNDRTDATAVVNDLVDLDVVAASFTWPDRPPDVGGSS